MGFAISNRETQKLNIHNYYNKQNYIMGDSYRVNSYNEALELAKSFQISGKYNLFRVDLPLYLHPALGFQH